MQESKPEPNMLKILPIIPSSTSQKITHNSYFILISKPIIPIVFFLIYSFRYWYLDALKSILKLYQNLIILKFIFILWLPLTTVETIEILHSEITSFHTD